jgi:nitroreductase
MRRFALDAIEAMESCGATRYLKSDPVPQELLERVLYAATRAPSPANSQGWDFIVVRDPVLKEKIRDLIAARFRSERASVPPPATEVERQRAASAEDLLESLARVPALIFVCGAPCFPPHAPMERFVWTALYPATQNLLVAARSLGLGTTMTTFQMYAENEIRELLGIPQEVKFAAMVPIGWPERPFVKVKRKPLAKVVHWDGWKSPLA